MSYRQRRTDRRAQLRSSHELELAMQAADLNGAELARQAHLSYAWVSYLRTGRATITSESYARSIERTLGVHKGTLFAYGARATELEGAAS